jgi:glucokinase
MQSEPGYIGALDIGGTKMAAIVAAREGPLARVTAPTPKAGSVRTLPEQGLSMIEQACAHAGVEFKLIDTVGVASCGPFVRLDGQLALAAPNICGGRSHAPDLPNDWEAVPVEQVLRERFARVVIDNDCVAALAAERSFGAVQGIPDCVYVTWSTGIGFGLCVDGRILRGKHGNAGHAGHMLMSEEQDAVCGCGNRGDLEALVSGRNVANRLHRSSADLFHAARSGETQALAAAQQAAQWFGRALYNLAAALDTSTFVIGGSIWTHHGEWLTPLVMQEIETRLPALTAGVTIVPAALGTLVADIGALTLVIPEEWEAAWRSSAPWQKLAA